MQEEQLSKRRRIEELMAIGDWEKIAEIYSPPRIMKVATEHGLTPTWALDLKTMDEFGNPWDFSIPERREAAWKLLVEAKPKLLIGSPMCIAVSTYQRLNASKYSGAWLESSMAEGKLPVCANSRARRVLGGVPEAAGSAL